MEALGLGSVITCHDNTAILTCLLFNPYTYISISPHPYPGIPRQSYMHSCCSHTERTTPPPLTFPQTLCISIATCQSQKPSHHILARSQHCNCTQIPNSCLTPMLHAISYISDSLLKNSYITSCL